MVTEKAMLEVGLHGIECLDPVRVVDTWQCLVVYTYCKVGCESLVILTDLYRLKGIPKGQSLVPDFAEDIEALTSDDPHFDLTFELDVDAEEELIEDEKAEFVDPALITGVQIRKCRLIATRQCVEYGIVSPCPNATPGPGILWCIACTIHPLGDACQGS
jgi:hypothetical protein